jgi:translocation protein SEC66
MNYLALLIPIAYIAILLGSLATFSSLYRARKLHAITSLSPYFPPHTQRNIYSSLLALQEDPNTKVPDSIIRAALLQRAVEDITRILHIRGRKPALQQLLQRGVVGDEIWQRLLRAEQEMEVEVKDVVSEANALHAGWGQSVFQSANEMVQNKMMREKLDAVRATVETEKLNWEARREMSRREIEGEVPAPAERVVLKEKAAVPATKAASSDEDAVLVETPAAVEEGGGKGKKKKGKK